MNVWHGGYEYAPYGDGYVRRVDGKGEWETLAPVDFIPHNQDDPKPIPYEALFEIKVQERLREERIASGPRQRRVFITRSPENIKIAEELGFDGTERIDPANSSEERNAGDTLAQRLNDARSDGSNKRIPELRFHEIAEQLGMDPQEMKDRFAGRYQTD